MGDGFFFTLTKLESPCLYMRRSSLCRHAPPHVCKYCSTPRSSELQPSYELETDTTKRETCLFSAQVLKTMAILRVPLTSAPPSLCQSTQAISPSFPCRYMNAKQPMHSHSSSIGSGSISSVPFVRLRPMATAHATPHIGTLAASSKQHDAALIIAATTDPCVELFGSVPVGSERGAVDSNEWIVTCTSDLGCIFIRSTCSRSLRILVDSSLSIVPANKRQPPSNVHLHLILTDLGDRTRVEQKPPKMHERPILVRYGPNASHH